MKSNTPRPRVTAVLGPTNTGKTYLAMERMLAHASGMIGFPLRLLARENYDRAVRLKGAGQVALITGEEKILPPDARYFLCTVESMPIDRRVAFLAVDEIQMCADPDRGHVFTDRLLHARGQVETMLMGAETVRPLLRRLVPEAEIQTRARMSMLSYAGARKLQRLPPRSAVVAFSTADVYVLAEIVRRQRGGAGVVLGALSPRTRNAQVAMYQAGEVDYLVATDAIGMGLNMDINHVAFAATRKFDGRAVRHLTPAELAQIAGRAGRHVNDGTFGTTAEIGPIDAEVAQRIEAHEFDPLEVMFWRNSELAFDSVARLQASLAKAPVRAGLVRAREADDELVLTVLARDAEIAGFARGRSAVRLLWEVCQIPDFQKVMSDAHAQLLAQIYRYLVGGSGQERRLPTDWIARHVEGIDRIDGGIETLMQRIAHIRTWTYVSHRADWVGDAAHWQERTRGIEDKLSDVLHERLIQRFVDRRTSVLVGRMQSRGELLGAVTAAGDVLVEGEYVGTLRGFRFLPDSAIGAERPADSRILLRMVNAAVARALRGEIARRVDRLVADVDTAFSLDDDGRIAWHGAPVARLTRGDDVLRPQVEADASDLLEAEPRERLRRRLATWLADSLERRLRPLFVARQAAVSASARGLLFQLAEGLGTVPRQRVAPQLAALDDRDRRTLTSLGVRFGRESLYVAALLKPDAIAVRRILWGVHHRVTPPPAPSPGRVSVAFEATAPAGFYEAVGYRPLPPLAVRIDIVERVAARARTLSAEGEFRGPADLCSMLGCRAEDLPAILGGLGYRHRTDADGPVFRRAPATDTPTRRAARRPRARPESPFASLGDLARSR